MITHITTKKVDLETHHPEWIERRLQFALGRFAARIRRVQVLLTDANGTRGGIDRQCQLRIVLAPHGEIVVEDIDLTIEAVVANAADRAARSVARYLERSREHRSQDSSKAPKWNTEASNN